MAISWVIALFIISISFIIQNWLLLVLLFLFIKWLRAPYGNNKKQTSSEQAEHIAESQS